MLGRAKQQQQTMDSYNKNNNREQQQQRQQQVTNENILQTTTTTTAIATTPQLLQQQQQQHPSLTAFEYYLPIADGNDDNNDDDTESNKSTPYYTPLEFCASSFEFPSPKPKHTHTHSDSSAKQTDIYSSCVDYERSRKLPPVPPSPSSSSHSSPTVVGSAKLLNTSKPLQMYAAAATSATTTAAVAAALHSPPVVNRKIRRFSLYERRSCSPQHLLAKNSASISSIDTNVYDKENTKPASIDEPSGLILLTTGGGGNNSPLPLIDDTNSTTTTGSPKILGAANEANMFGGGRLTYSPKLLASINNLNLSGSPLSALSSAGYKNGNYFKFPEIDHVVHAGGVADAATNEDINLAICRQLADNQTRGRHTESTQVDNRSSETTLSRDTSSRIQHEQQQQFSKTCVSSVDARKNRKNKHNLTIRITDTPAAHTQTPTIGTLSTGSTATSTISPSPSPSPKPKTPTIKSTKEKALSLDSAAAGDTELKIIVSSRNDSHVSCNEIDVNTTGTASLADTIFIKIPDVAASHLSTSLNQLSLSQSGSSDGHSTVCGSTALHKTFGLAGQRLGEPFMRNARRRVSGSTSGHTEWYQRQQHTFLSKSLNVDPGQEGTIVKSSGDVTTEPAASDRPSIYTKVMQTSNASSGGGGAGTTTNASTGQRGPFKHNPILHASNTNLKTLPEFLTLVEFSNTKDTPAGESPYKQKSMDLPSSSSGSALQNVQSALRVKPSVTTSTSSTNLLQRRGSNHSLTLNLHGSCSNLLGNCRSGLSVSNYSLGSVAANSTTNLNSKSSGNLALGSVNTATQLVVDAPVGGGAIANNATATAQITKQTLFRRRGSNHSLTLTNLGASSCGSLNSFASQNSLNVDRLHLHPSADGGGCGVTRTTSFITPNKTATSSIAGKRGLLERRGSNQSLTLNMGGSFGGIGTERNHVLLPTQYQGSSSNYHLNEQYGTRNVIVATEADAESTGLTLHPSTSCAQHRKFFSSESLNRANTQFSDLNQTHKRNANQVCFGSVSDLKPTDYAAVGTGSREHFDFQESTVCTCTGVRNIGTRPLSPQTTSEEFKIYLANIQMLQNASNALNQLDLIKLNYIFDSSYLSNNKGIANQPLPVLSVHECKEAETPPGLLATSEDHEVAARFQQAVGDVLARVQPDDNETKRLFCDLHKEFWDLPLNHQEKPMVFGSQAKNRYKTILPNENSRVLLEKESNIWTDLLTNYECLNDVMSESLTPRLPAIAEEVPYINANYIKGPDYNSKCYVATQGPLPNTIFEFWLMVYLNTQKHLQNAKKLSSPITKNGKILQQYYPKIVMLTNFLENNRQKCATYFPVDLNEIFVVTPKHEVLPTSERLNDFLNEYLQADDEAALAPIPQTDCDEKMNVSIEFLKTTLTAEQSELLPKNTNFFAVKNVGIVRKNGFSIRKLIVLYCVNIPTKEASRDGGAQQFLIQKFRCYHYWYPDWPDHRSPRDINTLLDICLHVLNLGKCEVEFDAFADSDVTTTPAQYLQAQEIGLYQQDIFNSVQPLPVIHCSAGIGRTGCFTAILNGIRQLRQSLAYSLTSMAAAATKRDHNGHVLSPVDFCLPTDFVEQQPPDEIDHIMNNDTDSSFTRNTLLYLKYILERNEDRADVALCGGDADVGWQLPSLSELPKMPDVFVDILGIVCNLRLQRGGMVQNSEQYELIHRAICLYMKRAFALKRF